MFARIDIGKIELIKQDFLQGQTDSLELAKKLCICRCTVNKYRKEFREMQQLYPRRLKKYGSRMPMKWRIPQPGARHEELHQALPALIDKVTTSFVKVGALWQDYRRLYPDGLSYNIFQKSFYTWRKKTNTCVFIHRRVKEIPPEDRAILNNWYRSNRKDRWAMAIVLLGSFEKRPLRDMAKQVEKHWTTLLNWIEKYKRTGLTDIIHKPEGANQAIRERTKIKQDNILKLLHETPKIHGFNRTSWKIDDMVIAYKQTFGEPIGATTIRKHLDKMGFGFEKSRQLLTSPDPKFREKVAHIQNILSNLKETERFFSVDEYGHFSVKLIGGRSIGKKGQRKIIPQLQHSKGFLIVTAALELSTNQVTHFYSRKKDTEEMIKLLNVLIGQYAGTSKIYFSWDKASWHASKKLFARIEEINQEEYRSAHNTPIVELAPLPASAQFLNVIESVFSGLAKAVIHNSDYESLDDCMAAIDGHFQERNAHFFKNPKRAGNFIWGKEMVKPVFSETNTCRYNRSV
jgi:transposase